MNKIKIDNYYKPESKTLRLDEVDYTIIPNSDIKPLLDKLEQENKRLKDNWNELKEFIVKEYYMYLPLQANTKPITILIDKMQEIEQGSDSNE